MSAAEALNAARSAGVKVRADGDDLVLEADAPPPAGILERLALFKPEIVARLRPGPDGWSAEDWQAYFEERARIAEFDRGLPRAEATARAFSCCMIEWLNRNVERSLGDRCVACRGSDQAGNVLLPHGVEPRGHVWLHSHCWSAWHKARKAEAVAVLEKLGVATRFLKVRPEENPHVIDTASLSKADR